MLSEQETISKSNIKSNSHFSFSAGWTNPTGGPHKTMVHGDTGIKTPI